MLLYFQINTSKKNFAKEAQRKAGMKKQPKC